MKTVISVVTLFVFLGCASVKRSIHIEEIQWEVQIRGTTVSLRGVSAVSPKIAWASGSRGTVLRTTDGGEQWDDVSVADASNLDFRDIHGMDASSAIIMSAGQPARFYKTTDGGETWTIKYEDIRPGAFFDSMDFWDNQNGIAFSDPVEGGFLLMRTTDAGENWHQIPPENIPSPREGEAAFAASGTMIAVQGENDVWFGTGGTIARVLRSMDRGVSWTAAETPILSGESSWGIFSIVFQDDKNGVIVGGDYRNADGNEKNCAVTTDGGVTWELVDRTTPAGFRSGMATLSVPGSNCYVTVGLSGSDFTNDGGRTWVQADTVGYHAISIAKGSVVGWAVGSEGRIGKCEVRMKR